MDQEKKQKVMVAVIVVAILGAGTAFWMSSGSGNRNAVVVDTGPVVRATRADSDRDTGETTKRAERKTPTRRVKETTPERKERQERVTTETRRARRDRTEQRKEKKKELPPMG